jgi:DNA polymerase III epsilon subunit-like protein
MTPTQPAQAKEAYIVIDIEASGPNPSQYSMLSIGACTVSEPRHTFYVEIQPDKDAFTEDAMAVSGLSMEQLAAEGLPPARAMQEFAAWLDGAVPKGVQPVFAAFNAPFDWMFVNDYFHRYLGYNPFGHAALDIKAYYMGLHGVAWGETTLRKVSHRHTGQRELTHHALSDAIDTAEILEAMLSYERTSL